MAKLLRCAMGRRRSRSSLHNDLHPYTHTYTGPVIPRTATPSALGFEVGIEAINIINVAPAAPSRIDALRTINRLALIKLNPTRAEHADTTAAGTPSGTPSGTSSGTSSTSGIDGRRPLAPKFAFGSRLMDLIGEHVLGGFLPLDALPPLAAISPLCV